MAGPAPDVRSLRTAWSSGSALHHGPARLARGVLLADPGIGGGHACPQRRPGLPAEDVLDEGVVAVPAGHALWRTEVIRTGQADPGDLLDDRDQLVDRDELARTEVD